MTSPVRITTLPHYGLADRSGEPSHPWSAWHPIHELLKRRLPGPIASLWARPQNAETEGEILWLTELQGEVVPLTSLSGEERAQANVRLDERLTEIRRMALLLHRVEPESIGLVDAMQKAAPYPGDDYVFLVGGEPVIVFWGFEAADIARAKARMPKEGKSRRWQGIALGIAGAVLLAGVGAWFWSGQQRAEDLDGLLKEVLQSDCAAVPMARLTEALARVDGKGQGYSQIRLRAQREQAICSDGARLKRQVDKATGHCDLIAATREALYLYDPARMPFKALIPRVEAEQARCDDLNTLRGQVDASTGNCTELRELARQLDEPQRQQQQYAPLRERLGNLQKQCNVFEGLESALDRAGTNCPLLLRFDKRLALYDQGGEPFTSLRARLDPLLARCDLGIYLDRGLAGAPRDCVTLDALARILNQQAPDNSMTGIRRRLELTRGACPPVTGFDKRIADAMGDCDAVDKLMPELAGYRQDPRFDQLRQRVLKERRVCVDLKSLARDLPGPGSDCNALNRAKASVANNSDPRFAALLRTTEQRIARCQDRERLTNAFMRKSGDCAALAQLAGEIEFRRGPHLESLHRRLDLALDRCEKQAKPSTAPALPKPLLVPSGGALAGLTGGCSGRLIIDSKDGVAADPQLQVLYLDPPGAELVKTVISSSPTCIGCTLQQVAPGVWRGSFPFPGEPGDFDVGYRALDAEGKEVCRARVSATSH